MSAHVPMPEPMETIVRLRRGTIARTVSITLTARLDKIDQDAASRAFEVFTRGLDAALSRSGKVMLVRAGVTSHAEPRLFVQTWEALYPAVSPGLFAVVGRLMASSVPGARRLEIREHADERTLVIRSFERENEATIQDVPWHLSFVPAKDAAVRIVFAEALAPATIRHTGLVLQAWADVLALGGFPGPNGLGSSTGLLAGVDASAERELVLRFRKLTCGHDAWEALFETLIPVAEEATIELVEIRGGA